MIDWVHGELTVWAEWSVRHDPLSHACPELERGKRQSPAAGSRIPLGCDVPRSVRLVDRAVSALPEPLRQTVVLRYLQPGTDDEKRSAMCLSRRAWFVRLDQAHWWIAGALALR